MLELQPVSVIRTISTKGQIRSLFFIRVVSLIKACINLIWRGKLAPAVPNNEARISHPRLFSLQSRLAVTSFPADRGRSEVIGKG